MQFLRGVENGCPVGASGTPYSRWGDWFARLCLAGVGVGDWPRS